MKSINIALIAVLALTICLFSPGCKKSSDPASSASKETWAYIQEKILTPSCATSGCHASTSDASYNQHGLVLSPSSAYHNLINAPSKNAEANAAGVLRVKAGDYLNSLLYQKINCHSGQYGATMPLGGPNLTEGQIEYIRQWILKGAPETGKVVDDAVLSNTKICSETFSALTPPAPSDGFQLAINPFSVSPNTEREVFIRRNTPNASTVYVNKFTLKGRPNSHHFVLYAFQNMTQLPPPNTLRDLYNADGTINQATFLQMQNHIFLAGGTDVNSTFNFPAGVALKIPANTALDLNAHYFNKQTSPLTGENYINLYTVPQANVIHEAKTLNLPNYNFSIPPNTKKTITTNFTFPNAVNIITLTSHFHKRGEKFQIKILGGPRDGEVVYESTDWAHPLVLNFTTPIQLQAGQGLTSVVTYNNTTNQTISFGLTSEDEMNIIFGYYY